MIEHEHQENIIKALRDRLQVTYLSFQTHGKEHHAQLEIQFKEIATKLCLICCAYFESKGMNSYLQDFKIEMRSFLDNDNKLFQATRFDEQLGQYFSVFDDKIDDYLNAFPAFSSLDFIMKRPGLKYLEHILENTHIVLNAMGVIPQKETEISRNMKFICEVTFPDTQFLGEPFVKAAKCYKPDLLIPSLNVAVEYKYAKTKQRLINTIDEILADVKGYSDHSTYKLFYAVFYVNANIISRQRFSEIWREKGFPKNWKGVLVTGN